mmetsp:Transcript_23086/g.46751  ORF Transcript_23086/g.46751 Transcript_23086/m.46751 type:complete len:220 (-) Transcript_23086:343-1002(-)
MRIWDSGLRSCQYSPFHIPSSRSTQHQLGHRSLCPSVRRSGSLQGRTSTHTHVLSPHTYDSRDWLRASDSSPLLALLPDLLHTRIRFEFVLDIARIAAKPRQSCRRKDVRHRQQLLGKANPLGTGHLFVKHCPHHDGLHWSPKQIEPFTEQWDQVCGVAQNQVHYQADKQLPERTFGGESVRQGDWSRTRSTAVNKLSTRWLRQHRVDHWFHETLTPRW